VARHAATKGAAAAWGTAAAAEGTGTLEMLDDVQKAAPRAAAEACPSCHEAVLLWRPGGDADRGGAAATARVQRANCLNTALAPHAY